MLRYNHYFLLLLFVMIPLVIGPSGYSKADELNIMETGPPASLYTYRAIITKVYDGDTVTADIDLGMKIWLRGERLRLWGIDTPELNRGNNRIQARIARDFLRRQILGKQVIVKTIKDRKGKYGRYLAIIYNRNVNINQLMLSQSLAKKYISRR